MKKILMIMIVCVPVAIFLFADIGLCRDKGNLYDMFRKEPVVKVYLSDIRNSSGNDKIDIKGLEAKLKDVLANRKSIRFEVVEGVKDADIIIDCDVTKYRWASEDPLDMIMGAGMIAMDLLIVESYAYMEALFTVTDARKDKTLWREKLKIDVTRGDMSLLDSLPLINEKTVKVFMRDCFSKRHRRSGGVI